MPLFRAVSGRENLSVAVQTNQKESPLNNNTCRPRVSSLVPPLVVTTDSFLDASFGCEFSLSMERKCLLSPRHDLSLVRKTDQTMETQILILTAIAAFFSLH